MWPFAGAKKRRVLIVDDDVHVRTMLGMYFGDSGWETSEAPDGSRPRPFPPRPGAWKEAPCATAAGGPFRSWG